MNTDSFLTKKKINIEHTESVLKYSVLLQEINKMIRLVQTLRKETKILTKIKKILTFNETMNPQMLEEVIKTAAHSIKLSAKISHLSIIYENLNNHRNFLGDYLILYLGALIDDFKIFNHLDYRRVLYIKKQIIRCKQLLLINIKEGCPVLHKKFLEMSKSKKNRKKREIKLYF